MFQPLKRKGGILLEASSGLPLKKLQLSRVWLLHNFSNCKLKATPAMTVSTAISKREGISPSMYGGVHDYQFEFPKALFRKLRLHIRRSPRGKSMYSPNDAQYSNAQVSIAGMTRTFHDRRRLISPTPYPLQRMTFFKDACKCQCEDECFCS